MQRTLLIGIMGAQVFLGALSASAAEPPDARATAEIKRGMAAVGPTSSDAAALRGEANPSPAFALGAALAAWRAAREQVMFDEKSPEGAGPPHNSQSGDTDDYVMEDCAAEALAFSHLETRSREAGLEPAAAVSAAGASAELAQAWPARRAAGPTRACRR